MIAVLDYGIGNLRSAEKALQHLGADATLVDDPDIAATAAGMVLPGVGAFGPCAAALRATRAFVFAVPLNCIGIGYGMLAMRKVIVALGVTGHFPALPGDTRLWAVIVIVLVTRAYTTVSGLWGGVAT